MLRISGIGIDLVDLNRAGRFLKEHRATSLNRLFFPSERKFIQNKPSVSSFAKAFAAKEAFFKALGLSWMGLEGFKKIKLKILPNDRFTASSVSPKKIQGQGRFFESRKWVGAQVIVTEQAKNKRQV